MATWKKVVVSGSNAELNTLRATSVTASLLGTASFAITSLTASYALNAGVSLDTSSLATTGSNTFVGNQIITGSLNVTGGITGSLLGTASFATSALSSSRAGVAGTVDSISGNITNNTDNRILTATGGGTINGETNLTFNGSTLALTGDQTVSGNVTVEGDLTVNGTTTTLNTQNLFVEDKFVLLASGSVTATDGGIVIAASASGTGYGFGYDASADRWALEDNLHATGSSFSATPTSYIVSAQSSTSAPAADPAYGGSTTGWGNIHVDTNTGEIFIYS
jgi:hypothetical protein